MSSTLDALLGSWPVDPWLWSAVGVMAVLYVRGWRIVRRRDARRWGAGLLAAFLAGLFAVFLALGSPLEPFAAWLLQVHMIQHLLLMMVAPPLLWLGAPLLPLVRGLPAPLRREWAVPLLRSHALRSGLARLTHPAPALCLFLASTWFWHVPAVYESALSWSTLHYLQHAFFLGTGLVFWYPVVRPFPARPRWSRWLLFPYLITADVSNTVLSALLTFADRPLYASYARAPRLGGLSVLDDQATAGVIMWVPGTVAFLLPLFAIAVRLLVGPGLARPRATPPTPPFARAGEGQDTPRTEIRSPLSKGGQRGARAADRPPAQALAALKLTVLGNPPPVPARFDLLSVPLLGPFLRWRHARATLQFSLLLMALVLVIDGLRGPQVGAVNLAGVVPWIHWRGLVVLGLLAAGNVSCMACPFLLPRTLARRWLPASWRWPRRLRSKWLAVLLIAVYLWAYEAFALWDRPAWTALIIAGYFGAAFVIDGLVRGASFCKYICPIGQFNFVQSQVSPLEVSVRDHGVCAQCRTRDCIRGRDGIPGCELGLFQPRKIGNLDCTFCLDCVHSCPHGNVGVLATLPGRELLTAGDRARSGLGRLERRADLAALVLVVVYGGLANALGMVGPVVQGQERLQAALGLRSLFPVTAAFSAAALVVLPLSVQAAAAWLCRRWGRLGLSVPAVATRFAYTLVPLGFGIWLAHLSFHLLTSLGTIVPTAARFANDLGWQGLGTPDWSCSCGRPVSAGVLRLELTFLDLGMLLSLYTAYRACLRLVPSRQRGRALKALAPWAIVIVLLFAAGVWVVFQPMQMRGTLPGAA